MSRPVAATHTRAAIAIAVVMMLSIAHIYANVLGGSLFSRPQHVTVNLTETGGLFEGSGVSYRGVRVGSVAAVTLTDKGATVDVALKAGAEVPESAQAVVRTLSPAGEQFLDLQPEGSRGPYLADGATISASRSASPTTVAQALRSIDTLMDQVNENDLQTIFSEAHAALGDPEDLSRVVDATAHLIEVLDSVWPETERVLINSRTILRTGVETSNDFRAFATSSAQFAAWLKEFDPTVRSVLDTMPSQTRTLQEFVDLLAKVVPPMLQDYLAFTGTMAHRDPHVRALLQQFPIGFNALASAFKDGRLQTNMLLSENDVCTYGLTDTNPQLSREDRVEFDHDLQCPLTFPLQQRGSAWRPGPTP